MKILSIDTATESASCAVLEDSRLLGEISINFKKQHSVTLMNEIDYLLKILSLNITDIDGFVISKGPGSFTGLRIGAAAIKGLCHGTNKDFVAVSSLESLANNMAYTDGLICPMIDALRDKVYTSIYKYENGKLNEVKAIDVMEISKLIDYLKDKNQPITFIGDGLYKNKGILEKSLPNARFAPNNLNLARASSLGEIGMDLLKQGKKDNIFSYAPMYLTKSLAEREYEKREGKPLE
ncbi:MAG: tRNA (adenosine(37)-N6)-threonylcarbamoyltransferase complex dimerization subunit type 1 TsaB [Clostridiaceae bacterium]